MTKFTIGLGIGYLIGYMVGVWVGSYTQKRIDDND
jgi:hypothetical protein